MENDSRIRSVCVYCSASDRVKSDFIQMAHAVGKVLAESGLKLIYGGSHVGLMKAVADGAIAGGGETHGVTTDHLYSYEHAHEGLDVLEVVPDMHTRKMRMFDLADAILVLPGGFGTLDETIEVFTWKQLGLHDKPMVLMNYQDFWGPLLVMMDHIIEHRFASERERTLMKVVTQIDEILPALLTL